MYLSLNWIFYCGLLYEILVKQPMHVVINHVPTNETNLDSLMSLSEQRCEGCIGEFVFQIQITTFNT